ncbi:uncharacterized protein LOC120350211 [Nilaparvata lugens]|uniref:uncharacterized protein LOC120350211 n=1 Tax=Nilaparvata lugens TaxID=108931 RepID=UPI00193E5BF8|nr:uncharacterized protein LOC120350211 [Nilaparvata lugens]
MNLFSEVDGDDEEDGVVKISSAGVVVVMVEVCCLKNLHLMIGWIVQILMRKPLPLPPTNTVCRLVGVRAWSVDSVSKSNSTQPTAISQFKFSLNVACSFNLCVFFLQNSELIKCVVCWSSRIGSQWIPVALDDSHRLVRERGRLAMRGLESSAELWSSLPGKRTIGYERARIIS